MEKVDKLVWDKLLNQSRRKDKVKESSAKTGKGREEIERDFDRVLFSAPTRRLADKTQVFPLDSNDSVRTRLTHSHEVANLARSLGVRISFESKKEIFGDIGLDICVERNVPSLLATIGLAHDLGNPPFGHQGEEAIRQWFAENNQSHFENKCHNDFLNFDGNAQTFRLLTRLQILNDDFGLNLTYATLAGLLKYPSFHDSGNKNKYDKWGIFDSERKIAKEVWEETGLKEGQRHPLTYLMEACDDIAYSVIDAEDTVKKGYASFYDLINYFESSIKKDNKITDEQKSIIENVIHRSTTENEKYKLEDLSSSELNDLSMQMFRVFAIYELIVATHNAFIGSLDSIMDDDLPVGFKLIKESNASKLCKYLKNFDQRYGFGNNQVLKLELEGSNYIKSLMDLLWFAIENKTIESEQPNDLRANPKTAFVEYAYGRISENYRRQYDKTEKKMYNKCQLLCDVMSGMTDSYIISLHNELRPLYDGYRSKK